MSNVTHLILSAGLLKSVYFYNIQKPNKLTSILIICKSVT